MRLESIDIRSRCLPLLSCLFVACGGGDSGGPTEPDPEPVEPVPATLSGVVTDRESGEPMAGVQVHTVPATRTVTTDAEGRYLIDGLSVGETPLTFSVVAELPTWLPDTAAASIRRHAPDEEADLRLHRTLRSIASTRGLRVGTAPALNHFEAITLHRNLILEEFDTFATGWGLFFSHVHPQRDQYDFAGGYDYFEAIELSPHPFEVNGHVLVWHSFLPGWLLGAGYDREEMLDILEEHITTVVGEYAGEIPTWDVVNEVIADDWSGMRETIWLNTIGPEYVDSAFVWAHRADPDARLCINDYGVEGGPPGSWRGAKTDSLVALVGRLVDRGVPIHCVGMQMHVQLDDYPAAEDLRAAMSAFSDLGLTLRISEMDVRIPEPATTEDLERQRDVYHEIVSTALENPSLTHLVFWDWTDRYSWIEEVFDGFEAAHLYDGNYVRKPAYYGVLDALAEWVGG